MIQTHAVFHGKVQGVFFRRSVFDHAKNFSVNGYVRNLSDDTVEALFQGEKLEIEKLISLIKETPGSAVIKKIELKHQGIEQRYLDFIVEY